MQKLVLCNNALSDQGIQKLTTPSRMFQKGPQHLSFIDLNGTFSSDASLGLQGVNSGIARTELFYSHPGKDEKNLFEYYLQNEGLLSKERLYSQYFP